MTTENDEKLPMVKATLNLTVIFEGEDASPDICKLQLEDIVRFAAAHGHMTGDLAMVVETFEYTTEAKEMDELDQLLEEVEGD